MPTRPECWSSAGETPCPTEPEARVRAPPRSTPRGTLRGMGFVPSARPNVADGEVDYRLARASVLRRFREGELSRLDVCDAHPELRRAAAEYSNPTDDDCPVCNDDPVVTVSYVFGPRLPSHGRCVQSAGDFARIRRRKGVFTCYVVEVCAGCGWNHLRRAYRL
jgi:hypothetical protein